VTRMVIIACASSVTTTAIDVGRNLSTPARSITTIRADGYVIQMVIGVTMNIPVISGTRCIGRMSTATITEATEDGAVSAPGLRTQALVKGRWVIVG
jgi:hypothetical protein